MKKKIRSYNEYVRYRETNGKLTESQWNKCKEGNLRGKFGFPTEIEEVADKLKIDVKKVADITDRFGSIDNFLQMYRDGKLSEKQTMLYNNNLINNMIDIDCNPLAENYSKLVGACFGNSFYKEHEFMMFSSEGMKEALETLTPREKEVMQFRFGLIDGKTKTFYDLEKHYSITRERVRQIEAKALRKLRYPSEARLIKTITIDDLKKSEYITNQERTALTNLENDMFISNLIFKHDSIDDIDFDKDRFDVIRDIQEKIKTRIEKEKEEKVQNISKNDIAIEEFDLSVRSFNCLKRAGIETLADLENLTYEELMKIKNVNQKSLEEIVSKAKRYGITFEDADDPDSIGTTEGEPAEKVYSDSEMEKIKAKKTELEAKLKALDEQTRKARELLAEYNKLIGDDDKVNTDDEPPDFKDE